MQIVASSMNRQSLKYAYKLQKVEQLMYERIQPLYKTNANQRTFKEAIDRDTLSKALEKAYLLESKSADTHFIIGSRKANSNKSSQKIDRMDVR